MIDKEYNAGKKLKYMEYGFVYLVEVLENLSDYEYMRYGLIVVDILEGGNLNTRPLRRGDKFVCGKFREDPDPFWNIEDLM